ncbi:MAG: site-specific DNA-methyltransferase [Leptolyngbyaceae cyanobacterium SM1_1_3]|nr:site-specific DNA-methyltransferase [Leptolyngbyaceae cyanobacterium SM1_1_3]NJN02959.1 site-specific DNA-methyltransferase [Leptolyngbyaceae cyanobacterium RM1_1_2]NJO08840.1 site-specific DNA-methyltransferase [Leptolyngbyaceae cyanobacterium SL_1_1]
MDKHKPLAPQNRTLVLSAADRQHYRSRLLTLQSAASLEAVTNRTLQQNFLEALPHLPAQSVDLLFLDPPYNLNKTFNQQRFGRTSLEDYEQWLESWFAKLLPLLKPTATIYCCGDWQSSSAIHRVISQHCKVRNRITWEREKGRGAKANWKNCSEDIWFCTLSNNYVFNVEAVKLKRRVLAPYRDRSGQPKDWQTTDSGNFRITYPSNLWTDISVPFWSMPENTDHPTQKPEKLLAKLILASSEPDGVVLDPFLGSGTTSVVAKKLGRRYIGIERDEYFCCLAEKRLASTCDRAIQGYSGGYFWERNTFKHQQCQASPKLD